MTQKAQFTKKKFLGLGITSLIATGVISTQALASADDISNALTSGTAYGDFRLRYEYVDQDNTLDSAKALTLRSRLGYNTGAYEGFSATMEFEDSRVVADQDRYTTGGYSVIADPETTELDQGYLQYKNDELTVKFGRQVLILDNHRFVGDVGWRQDRQTFDALTINYKFSKDLQASYAYLGQRNRILAETADKNSKDKILNISYSTGLGKLTAYSYLLEEDNGTDNSIDTFGLRFAGATDINEELKALYTLEYAYQENEAAGNALETNYMLVEGGLVFSGITAKLSYEVLGSKDGLIGFTTPLATLHKFNGWADQFLNTPNEGLSDLSVSFSGKLAGGKWLAVYHDFNADDSSVAVDDLGSELDLSYSKGFGKNYSAGLKYAAYSAGDIKVDTDKVWLLLGAKF
tara:strand:- start:110 stop:1324 length:1215 start_codon:yes stop_codon:yes gene_type:complete